MAELPDRIRAFVAERSDDSVERRLDVIEAADLPPGEVTIRVEWSSLNYKDGLAVSPNGQVARISPLVPGIDLAGEVVASDADAVGEGDRVLVHGYALGVSHHGGLAEYARVPAGWVVPLPADLSERQAMALGTAGFTAALSVVRLEQHGVAPGGGPVLVLGATGGVGSTAVGILSRRGYEVHASTGKPDQEPYLRGLGAAAVLPREETSKASARPLESQLWAACVDPVGGAPLAYALRTTRYGGAIASSGLTAGTRLETTVLPFVLRAVSVLGIDSVELPIDERREIWARLADDLRPNGLDESITREVTLDGVDATLDELLAARAVGRTVARSRAAAGPRPLARDRRPAEHAARASARARAGARGSTPSRHHGGARPAKGSRVASFSRSRSSENGASVGEPAFRRATSSAHRRAGAPHAPPSFSGSSSRSGFGRSPLCSSSSSVTSSPPQTGQ